MDSLALAPGLMQMVMQILTGMEVKIQEGFIFSTLDDNHVLNPINWNFWKMNLDVSVLCQSLAIR